MPSDGTSVASGVDEALYPAAVLIDELRHDDVQVRLNSVRNLATIATALGQERTREELLPFLQELIDDEDDLLIALAEQLQRGIPWVGGPAYAYSLTGPLEELCTVEEMAVRNKATEVLKSLTQSMSSEQIARHMCALMSRLAAHDWFTARISACSLFPTVLPKVSEGKQDDLLKIYFRLCGDDTPMVRREAAMVLGGVAEALQPEAMLREVVEVFEKLAKDEQDSVRIMATGNCIALAKLKCGAEWQAGQILNVVKASAEDRSWRVRYVMAENIKDLCDAFKVGTTVLPFYLRLLSDQEDEVRTIAAAQLAAVAAVNPSKEFLETLMPALEKLTLPREQCQHVRVQLAGSILAVMPIFGAKLTADYLISIFLTLIRDESSEVRLKLISSLGDLSSVLGGEVLSQSLMPAIKDLGKDRQWRVRLGIIECMPAIANYIGEAQFTQELSNLLMAWLMDPVFSVRDAAATNFKQLSELLGTRWTEVNLVPQLQTLLTHKNYLYRISSVLCAGTLAQAAAGPFLDKHIVPMVVQLCRDPVPNVRFNAAKTIQAMHKGSSNISLSTIEDNLVPCLWRLLSDEDPDVKFYAGQAIESMGVKK